jgi:hypothetical protein
MKTIETLSSSGSKHAFCESRNGKISGICVVAACLIALVLPSAVQAAKYSGGAGTDVDPYVISTPADWRTLIATQNDWDKDFVLTADLDFVWEQLKPVAEDGNPFSPGYQGTGFTGRFDGGGHYIRRVILDLGDESCVGLFAYVGLGGQILNLNLEDATVIGYKSVGGLVGECDYGVIANCSSKASVTGGMDVGGLVGGSILSQIVNCTSTSIVESASDAGALLGQNVLGLIMGCQSDGTVTGQNGIGGLVGWDDFGVIMNCRSMAAVTGTSIVGGLVGADQGYIVNSYSAGAVKGNSIVGGLVGSSNGTVIASFWDTTTSGQIASDGGTGKTTALMQSSKTYTDAGWDVAGEQANGVCDFWQVPAGKYPVLSLFSDAAAPKLEGDGSVRNPYLIKTVADLATIWRNPTANYRLTADLDLAGMKWGASVIPVLVGNFEGQGHRIKNLTLTSNGGFMAFIGSLAKDATVSDLGFEDASVAGRIQGTNAVYAQGDSFAGAAVGFNLGTVATCYSLGLIAGDQAVGGLVGFNCETGMVTNCYSRATARGHRGVGGLVGWNSGLISFCYSTGYVNGSLDAGGLVGGLPTTGTGNIYKKSVVGSFWDTDTSQMLVSDGGFGRNTAQMRDINTFIAEGWDFTGEKVNGTLDLWQMPAWTSYPLLAWQKVSQTALTVEGFESGTFTALSWRTGGDKPWVIATAEHYSGKYSAQAGAIAQGQTSTLELTGQFGYGDVSFALQVSSEVFFDNLSFSIDGVEQGAWSGKVWWTKVSFPIAPGRHTLTWTYSTDASDTAGRNTTWIDEVSVPIL